MGATPIQNVGAYGQEVAETIPAVRVLDRADGTVRTLPPEDCGFTYRSSAFKRAPGRWVVLAVASRSGPARSAPIRYAELARALGVAVGERAPLADVREAVLALRRGKGMVIDPGDADSVSAGSFFINPVLDAGAFAALEARAARAPGPRRARRRRCRRPTGRQDLGRVADRARGLRARPRQPGAIAISSKHTLALTNRGAGTTAELVAPGAGDRGGVQRGLRRGARARAGVRRARVGGRRDVGQAGPRRGSRRPWP